MYYLLRKAIFTVGLSVFFPLSAAWADFNNGFEAYKRGDFGVALREFTDAAEQGDARGQFNLGDMYEAGKGIPADNAKAIVWYEKAAEQGNANAEYNVGRMYSDGIGVPKNFSRAVLWYRKSADHDHISAQNNLGAAYVRAEGVEKNLIVGYALYKLAPSQGSELSANNLKNLVSSMSAADITRAQQLSTQMHETKLVTPVIDAYLKSNPRVSRQVAAVPKPAARSPFPAVPAKRPGAVSCNTQRTNGNCFRTYDFGKQVQFQAKQKFNPFNNQFEWDSGSC